MIVFFLEKQHDRKSVDKIRLGSHIAKVTFAMLNLQIMMQMFVQFQMLILMFSSHSNSDFFYEKQNNRKRYDKQTSLDGTKTNTMN